MVQVDGAFGIYRVISYNNASISDIIILAAHHTSHIIHHHTPEYITQHTVVSAAAGTYIVQLRATIKP
jgi:hypothetical protein